ncbi:MAG: ABC transporter permease [Pseudomonadota bacterium]
MSQTQAVTINADQPGVLLVQGAWVLESSQRLSEQLARLSAPIQRIDGCSIDRLDSSGALLLARVLESHQLSPSALVLNAEHQALFDLVQNSEDACRAAPVGGDPSWKQVLERTGQDVVQTIDNILELIGFLGVTLHRLVLALFNPRRLRWTSLVHHMQETGFNAVPLLALLAIMIGAVLAFLGATVLRDFGAEIMVIDLVTFAFLREFGVLLTAILLAGRTASAFCAQIGMMKSQQEIDAIHTMGLDDIELLVIPRVVALLVMLPALTVIATLAGLLGGLIVSVLSLDISVGLYIERVYQTVRLQDYLVGLIKAPIFALVIALIGCSEGLRVQGSAQSVGEHTTAAVVRSITMVIVIDALAAVYFMEIGW